MRSLLFFAMALMLSDLSAQTTVPLTNPEKNSLPSVSEKIKSQAIPKSGANVLLESDFSDVSEWIVDSDFGGTWVQSFDGPQGQFSIGPIESTTADNGFALYDSNTICADFDVTATIQYAQPLDLSDVEFADITVQTYYRQFQGSCSFQYSTNGGQNWTTTFLFTDLDVNVATPNPLFLTIPNALPGGFDEVLFRFRYDGACDYAWMLDDLVVTETADFNLAINDFYYDSYLLFEDVVTGDDGDLAAENFEYTDYRTNQVRPLTFLGFIENIGAEPLTNVTMTVTLTTPAGVEEFTSDPIAVLPTLAEDTLQIADVLPEAFLSGGLIGNYSVVAEVSCDQDEVILVDNQSETKQFRVNDEFLGNFSDQATAGDLSYLSSAFFSDDQIYGSVFYLVNPDSVNYIEFAYGNANILFNEKEVFLNIRRANVLGDPSETDSLYFGLEEVNYIVQEADLTEDSLKLIRVYLPNSVQLNSGLHQVEVLVPFESFGNSTIPLVRNAEFTSGTFFDFDDFSGGPQGWFVFGDDNPAIRCGFDPAFNAPIAITSQPQSEENACINSSVTFSVEGENIEEYQWQRSSNIDGEWFDLFEANEPSFTIASVDFFDSGTFYRCRVSNGFSTQFTEPAALFLDNISPELTVTADLPLVFESGLNCENGFIPDLIDDGIVIATDNCPVSSNGFTTFQNPVPGAVAEVEGTITLDVFDGLGNSGFVALDYVVVDLSPPLPNVDSLETLTLGCGEAVLNIPSAVDNCSGVIQGQTENETVFFEEGEYEIVWSYEDESGNETTQTQEVIVLGGNCCNASTINVLTLDTLWLQDPVCPGDTTAVLIRFPNTVVIPEGGGYALRFFPTNPLDPDYFTIINQRVYKFDNTLNGVANPGIEGTYLVYGFVFSDPNDPLGSICAQTETPRIYEVLSPEDEGCSGIVELQGGVTESLVYPNPANDRITIVDNLSGTSVIEIYDLQGRLVLEVQNGGSDLSKTVDVSALVSGVYTIKTIGRNGLSVGHFLKE
jgi:hypothetical protein